MYKNTACEKLAGKMWNHYFKTINFKQKIYPIRIQLDPATKHIQPVYKRSWLYLFENIQLTACTTIAFCRILNYLKSDSFKRTTTYTEFIFDVFFWGLGQAAPPIIWTLWKRQEEYCFFINQAYKYRKPRGMAYNLQKNFSKKLQFLNQPIFLLIKFQNINGQDLPFCFTRKL